MITNIEPQGIAQITVRTGNWLLVVGPRAICPTLLALTARLAELGPVRVVDCGNRYNVYPVARAARGRPEVLERIRVSRAFTCYQVLTLLESTPAIQVPLVVLDLLSTFYDESVQIRERKRLLRACVMHLERLEKGAGGSSTTHPTGIPCGEEVLCNVVETAAGDWTPPWLVVSVHPPKVPSQPAIELLGMLETSTVDTYFIQPAAPVPVPMRLF